MKKYQALEFYGKCIKDISEHYEIPERTILTAFVIEQFPPVENMDNMSNKELLEEAFNYDVEMGMELSRDVIRFFIAESFHDLGLYDITA